MSGKVGTIQSFFSTLMQPLSHLKRFLIATSALCAGKDNSFSFIIYSFQLFYLITLYCQQEDGKKTPLHRALTLTQREREREVSPKEQNNQRNGTLVKYIYLRLNIMKKYFSPSSQMPQHSLTPCAAVPA